MRLLPASASHAAVLHTVAVLAAGSLSVAASAVASTPEAWAQGMSEAKAACRKASDLRNAATLGNPVMFSDVAGKTAILVTGTWRPKHMRGARAAMLCLYDRAGHTAEVQEALKWTVRP